ncbi:MAG: tRNA 2-selenouridine(34) synthase MnmH [bacterium]|nr:tRNA 2-selenouridine(34) synthase MnmH [bacterium]
MLKLITISDVLALNEPILLLDARSEGEFEQGHIPGARSFPILNNEERKLVGTCYKQQGHQAAVILGYKLVGPKFTQYLKVAYRDFEGKEIYIHCWRGGLRSQIMSNLLSSAGFKVNLIVGGYKTYRAQVLDFFGQEFAFQVLGGLTGCAKSEILQEMLAKGAQVLDIENLANHKGSAFGSLGLDPQQPTQEQFENKVYDVLRKFGSNQLIWVEDESRLIGKLQVPNSVYEGIRNSYVHFLDYPFEMRLKHIIDEYGVFDPKTLSEITAKLCKRMGDLNNRMAIEALENGDVETWAKMVLQHYDKQYTFGFEQRIPQNSCKIELAGNGLIQHLLSIQPQES